MAIDRELALALDLPEFDATLERGRLQFFAQAIGVTDPVYVDVEAAKAAGHPDLPAPPTFLFSAELGGPDPFGYLDRLGVDLRFVLHGQQAFDLRQVVHAGDTIHLKPQITDVYAKKGGALEFVVKRTDVTRHGELVAQASTVIVVRHPEVTS